jgi:hypothetical protein
VKYPHPRSTTNPRAPIIIGSAKVNITSITVL